MRHTHDDSGDSDRSSVRFTDGGGVDEAAPRPQKRRRRSRWDAGPGCLAPHAHGVPNQHAHSSAHGSPRSSSEDARKSCPVLLLPQPQNTANGANGSQQLGGCHGKSRQAVAQNIHDSQQVPSAASPARKRTGLPPDPASPERRGITAARSDPAPAANGAARASLPAPAEHREGHTDGDSVVARAASTEGRLDNARPEGGELMPKPDAEPASPTGGDAANPAEEAARYAGLPVLSHRIIVAINEPPRLWPPWCLSLRPCPVTDKSTRYGPRNRTASGIFSAGGVSVRSGRQNAPRAASSASPRASGAFPTSVSKSSN